MAIHDEMAKRDWVAFLLSFYKGLCHRWGTRAFLVLPIRGFLGIGMTLASLTGNGIPTLNAVTRNKLIISWYTISRTRVWVTRITLSGCHMHVHFGCHSCRKSRPVFMSSLGIFVLSARSWNRGGGYIELSDKEALLTSSCWGWTSGSLESRVRQVVTKSLERRNADSTQIDHLVALSIRNLWELTWRAANHSKDPDSRSAYIPILR